jgi:hypothetical protein
MSERNFTDIKTAMDSLLRDYMKLSEIADSEPMFSMMNYIRLILKMFLWEIFIVFLPVTAFINLMIWIVNKIRTKKPINYVPNYFIRYTIKATKSIWIGDIPLLGFYVARYFTKVFTTLHVKRNIDKLEYLLQRHELKEVLANSEKHQIDSINSYKDFLNKYMNTYTKTIQLKFFVLISPYVLFMLDWSYKLFKPSIEINHINTWNEGYTILVMTTLLFFMFLTSSHIRNRELLSNQNLYLKEFEVFSMFKSAPPMEVPFDLIGWILLIALNFIPILMRVNIKNDNEGWSSFLSQVINVLGATTGILGFIFIRRVTYFNNLKRKLNSALTDFLILIFR